MSKKVENCEALFKMHPQAVEKIKRAMSFPLHEPIEIISGSADWKVKAEEESGKGVGIASFAITAQ